MLYNFLLRSLITLTGDYSRKFDLSIDASQLHSRWKAFIDPPEGQERNYSSAELIRQIFHSFAIFALSVTLVLKLWHQNETQTPIELLVSSHVSVMLRKSRIANRILTYAQQQNKANIKCNCCWNLPALTGTPACSFPYQWPLKLGNIRWLDVLSWHFRIKWGRWQGTPDKWQQ